MNILGLIPARGGSKGIKNKNLTPLHGHPLIYYTCKAACSSKLINRVILSSDDLKIANFVQKNSVEVPFLRPKTLALDTTPMIDVIQHALLYLKAKENYRPDAVILLQPTSPLRTVYHIDQAIQLFKLKKADSVVSVIEVPHNFSPVSVMKLNPNGSLQFPTKKPLILRRQDKKQYFSRNGPAILISKRIVFEQGHLYGKKVYPFFMRAHESVDIDNAFDLELAKFCMNKINV